MDTPRGKAFVEQEPELSEHEIERAKEERKIAISLRGKPVLLSVKEIGFIAVKFALADGTSQTVLLDRLSAAALRKLIQSVEGIDWKTDAVRPRGPKH
jgi:hypothetical protein